MPTLAKHERKRRIVDAITVLAEAFGRAVTSATFRAYEFGLEGIATEAIERACKQAMAKCRFMPVPAELRELAGESPTATRAALAWEAAREAVDRLGYIPSVSFDDPYITATIRNLWRTWEAFEAALETTQEHFLRRDFERVYSGLFGKPLLEEQYRPLLGAGERSYQASYGKLAGTPREQLPRVEYVYTGLPPAIGVCLPAPKQPRLAASTSRMETISSEIGRIPQ